MPGNPTYGTTIASFPGLAQLSVACNTEKRERALLNNTPKCNLFVLKMFAIF